MQIEGQDPLKIVELCDELETHNISLCAISEHRWKHRGTYSVNERWTFVFSGVLEDDAKAQKGVGFQLNQDMTRAWRAADSFCEYGGGRLLSGSNSETGTLPLCRVMRQRIDVRMQKRRVSIQTWEQCWMMWKVEMNFYLWVTSMLGGVSLQARRRQAWKCWETQLGVIKPFQQSCSPTQILFQSEKR